MSANEKPYSTSHLQPKPEPTLTEQIAEALLETYRRAPGSGWSALAARVEAFARAAALHARLQGGFDVALERPHFEDDDALLAALPALSTPPPEETR